MVRRKAGRGRSHTRRNEAKESDPVLEEARRVDEFVSSLEECSRRARKAYGDQASEITTSLLEQFSAIEAKASLLKGETERTRGLYVQRALKDVVRPLRLGDHVW